MIFFAIYFVYVPGAFDVINWLIDAFSGDLWLMSQFD